ncbi:DoxX family protein [Streptomyces cyaneus]|uniref:DoxX family protein n=1 Tax=Streptomyces cyaneus TaxID=1904 RepID=UPI000FF8B2E3|nr:DoxX family protein [Streptomyces cyaneus]
MNVFLWIVQGVLAAAFAASGVVKLAKPGEQHLPPGLVRLIGIAESVAAVGLVLPPALDVATILTPLAATGLAVLMALAMGFHARRKEAAGVAVTAVLLLLAAVVMWGRFGPHAF